MKEKSTVPSAWPSVNRYRFPIRRRKTGGRYAHAYKVRTSVLWVMTVHNRIVLSISFVSCSAIRLILTYMVCVFTPFNLKTYPILISICFRVPPVDGLG